MSVFTSDADAELPADGGGGREGASEDGRQHLRPLRGDEGTLLVRLDRCLIDRLMVVVGVSEFRVDLDPEIAILRVDSRHPTRNS